MRYLSFVSFCFLLIFSSCTPPPKMQEKQGEKRQTHDETIFQEGTSDPSAQNEWLSPEKSQQKEEKAPSLKEEAPSIHDLGHIKEEKMGNPDDGGPPDDGGMIKEELKEEPSPRDKGKPDKPPYVDPKIYCKQFDDPHELISDRRFRRGFIAMDPKTYKPMREMRTGICREKPIWTLTQWDSLGDLSVAPKTKLSDGSIRWSNKYGRITIGQGWKADASFGVWAFKEYNGHYHTPKPSRKWVHMLAEQRLSPPGVKPPGCPPLSSLAKLKFKMYAQLLKDNPNYRPGYSKNKHAAQFLIYFTVQNLNHSSSGYGDYLWFGLAPYDDRDPLCGLSIHGDRTGSMGTGKLIYNIGAAPFIKVALKPKGPEQKFEKDILPDIRKALLEAWKRGYLKGSHLLSDYRLGGMNIGWEIPGLNDAEMKVRELSLRYEKKSTALRVFNFNKNGDTEGWTAINMKDSNGGPVGGKWVLQVPGGDPQIISPVLKLDAATHKKIYITFANDHNPASVLKVYWERFGSRGFRESWSASIPVKNSGGWYNLTLDMSKYPAWAGEIWRIRIDPVVQGNGHSVGFDRIAL